MLKVLPTRPAQIADIAGDGLLEVLCVMNDRFLILEGGSGKLKAAHDLPGPMHMTALSWPNLREVTAT